MLYCKQPVGVLRSPYLLIFCTNSLRRCGSFHVFLLCLVPRTHAICLLSLGYADSDSNATSLAFSMNAFCHCFSWASVPSLEQIPTIQWRGCRVFTAPVSPVQQERERFGATPAGRGDSRGLPLDHGDNGARVSSGSR